MSDARRPKGKGLARTDASAGFCAHGLRCVFSIHCKIADLRVSPGLICYDLSPRAVIDQHMIHNFASNPATGLMLLLRSFRALR